MNTQLQGRLNALTPTQIVFGSACLVCAALALFADWLFGENMLGFYFSATFGLMYWIDVIPHGIAGAACAFFVLFVIPMSSRLKARNLYWYILAFTLTVGVTWEFYETLMGYDALENQFNIPGFNFHQFNTTKDVVVNCLGGLAAGALSSLLYDVSD